MSEVLYYYCSTSTFLNIIQNKKLWISNIRKMNDYTEQKWFHTNVLDRVFGYSFIHDVNGENNNSLIKTLNTLEKTWISYLSPSGAYPEYIICFSSEGDLLSQWRAYADDGMGIAIGFRKDLIERLTIHNESNFRLRKIHYSSSKEVEDVYSKIEGEIMKFIDEESIDFEKIIMDNLKINEYYTIKNPAFQEENEWRLVHTLGYTDDFPLDRDSEYNGFKVSRLKYRASKDNIYDYREIDFSQLCKEMIAEVIIGPKSKIMDYEVMGLLHDMQYSSEVVVKKSSATYR